ncbi:MAG: 5-methyltetrahydrofolate--homocysteine methyltransferase [Acetobacterium sp.]
MNTITKIPYRLDRQELFERMHIFKKQAMYEQFVLAYDELYAELSELLSIQGIHVLKENDEVEKIHWGLCEVSHLVYCLVTLGSKISEKSTALFKEKDFLKGLMIDSMADIILFNATNDYYAVIKKEIYENQGYALTMRYEPDDHDIPMKFQKTILEQTNGEDILSVGITQGFMYYPVKTLGYVYGADKDIELAEKDHDCINCSNLSCEYRNIEK